MYAVIRTGGKQYKVAQGDVIEIERVKDASETVEFTPLLVVDDEGVTHSGKGALAGRVQGRVVSESRGPKVDVYRFRNKTGYRRHTGHRQSYSSIEISDILLEQPKSRSATKAKGSNDGT